jgi:hypothetical protein
MSERNHRQYSADTTYSVQSDTDTEADPQDQPNRYEGEITVEGLNEDPAELFDDIEGESAAPTEATPATEADSETHDTSASRTRAADEMPEPRSTPATETTHQQTDAPAGNAAGRPRSEAETSDQTGPQESDSSNTGDTTDTSPPAANTPTATTASESVDPEQAADDVAHEDATATDITAETDAETTASAGNEPAGSWAVRNRQLQSDDELDWPAGFTGFVHAADLTELPDDVQPFTGINTQSKNNNLTIDEEFEWNGVLRDIGSGETTDYLDVHWWIDERLQIPVLTRHVPFATKPEAAPEFERFVQNQTVECRFEHIGSVSVGDDNYAITVPQELHTPADADAGTVYVKPGTRYVGLTNKTFHEKNAAWLAPLDAYQDQVGYPFRI